MAGMAALSSQLVRHTDRDDAEEDRNDKPDTEGSRQIGLAMPGKTHMYMHTHTHPCNEQSQAAGTLSRSGVRGIAPKARIYCK